MLFMLTNLTLCYELIYSLIATDYTRQQKRNPSVPINLRDIAQDILILLLYALIISYQKKRDFLCKNIYNSPERAFGGLISFHPDCRLGAPYETWTHTRLLSLPPQGSVSAIPPKVHINSIYESVDSLSCRQLHRITLSSIMYSASAWRSRFVDNLHLNLHGIFTAKHHRLKNWVNTYFRALYYHYSI